MEQTRCYDFIIAGGGVSGILSLVRCLALKDSARILMIDESTSFGGKAKLNADHWPIGLKSLISEDLKDYFLNIIQNLGFSTEDFSVFFQKNNFSTGVLSGKDWDVFPSSDLQQMAYALGGLVGKKKFYDFFKNLMEESMEDGFLGKSLKLDKKDPLTFVLNHMVRYFGSSHVSHCSISSLRNKIKKQKQLFFCDWNDLTNHLLDDSNKHSHHQIDVSFDNLILKGQFSDQSWILETKKGFFWSKKLIVAQDPWSALKWLDPQSTPSGILNLESKKKPTSSVCLTEKTSVELDLPSFFMIPSENVEVIYYTKGFLSYQSIMDYELSFDHQAVEKSLKKIKRAQKKLHTFLGEKKDFLSGEYISICPNYFSFSMSYQDKKMNSAISDSNWFSSHLGFVSASYGFSDFESENIMNSLCKTFECFLFDANLD